MAGENISESRATSKRKGGGDHPGIMGDFRRNQHSGPARSELRLAAASPCAVETPYPATSDKEVKEDKTINDCQLAAIKQRKEAARRMRHEISDRHVAS